MILQAAGISKVKLTVTRYAIGCVQSGPRKKKSAREDKKKSAREDKKKSAREDKKK